MRRFAVLLCACLFAPRLLASAAAASAPLSAEEKAYCEEEIQVVERRARIFQEQGLPPREAARRNEREVRVLEECRVRFHEEARKARERKDDLEELARRAGPDATEKERDRAWREIRRERLASKDPARLDADERAELAAGTPEELAATHAALDAAHARDPAFLRAVHSALACYHRDCKEELEAQISSEEALLKLGGGDRQKLYALRSAVHESDEVLARAGEAARGLPGGLERCTNATVAVVAHCLAIRFRGGAGEAACDAEEIQQYVRFVK
jgi:hypothetical protein